MKKPTYFLKEDIQDGEFKFPAWTEIQPIFNEAFVPEHRREQLRLANKVFNYNNAEHVMCIIGRHWLAVDRNKIVERT